MGDSSARQALHQLASCATSPITRRNEGGLDGDLYFDPLSGFVVRTPPVISEILNSSGGLFKQCIGLGRLIGCYDRDIRISKSSSKKIPDKALFLLEFYELLLNLSLQAVEDFQSTNPATNLLNVFQVEHNNELSSIYTEVIDTIHCICKDLIDFSIANGDDRVHGRILPVLIRILSHSMTCFFQMKQNLTFSREALPEDEVVSIVFVTLISLSYYQLSPLDIIPSLLKNDTKNQNDEHYNLNFMQTVNKCMAFDNCVFLETDFEEFYDLFSLRNCQFKCDVSSLTHRVALQSFASLRRNLCQDDKDESKVFSKINIDVLAQTVRSFFFGKNNCKDNVLKSNEYSVIPENSPWRKISCRVHGSIRVITRLRFPYMSTGVLDALLPIVYTLIDESIPDLRIIGACTFVHILRQSTSTEMTDRFTLANQVLNIARRANREASVSSILALSTYELLQKCSSRSKIYDDMRRNLADLLSSVSICFDSQPENAVALVSSGVAPLLAFLAQRDNPELIEIVRPCLAALIPIIESSSISYGAPIIITSLSCIISLVKGSWPIIHKHSKKIIVCLLICIGKCDRSMRSFSSSDQKDSVETNKATAQYSHINKVGCFTKSLAIYAAAITIAVCGKSAEEVLLFAERDCAKDLGSVCDEIRRQASQLLLKYE